MDLISDAKAGWLLWHSQMLCILLSKCFDTQGCSFCKILCSTNLGVCGICILFLSQWSSFPSRNLMSSSLSNAELKESICMPAICLMCYFRSTYMSVIIFQGYWQMKFHHCRQKDLVTIYMQNIWECLGRPLQTRKKYSSLLIAQSLNRLFATPWTVAHEAPQSMGFSRQEQWIAISFSINLLIA